MLTLNVVQVHRALRLGSIKDLEKAHAILTPLISDYRKLLFRNNQWVIPQGLGAADFSERFLLGSITASCLQDVGWKSYVEETADSANTLMNLARHILPAEYGKFIGDVKIRNNTKAARILRTSAQKVRGTLRLEARGNVATIINCLGRLRLLEWKGRQLLDRSSPDL